MENVISLTFNFFYTRCAGIVTQFTSRVVLTTLLSAVSVVYNRIQVCKLQKEMADSLFICLFVCLFLLRSFLSFPPVCFSFIFIFCYYLPTLSLVTTERRRGPPQHLALRRIVHAVCARRGAAARHALGQPARHAEAGFAR